MSVTNSAVHQITATTIPRMAESSHIMVAIWQNYSFKILLTVRNEGEGNATYNFQGPYYTPVPFGRNFDVEQAC